jgi:hypothetical protein
MRTVVTALAALLLAAAPAFAQSIAFITNLKGDASIDGAVRPSLLAELAKGQKISLAREANLSVMYIATGKEYVLKGPGEFIVKDTEVSASSGMPPKVRTTEWRTSNKVLETVAQVAGASVRMRSLAAARDSVPVMLFPTAGRIATLQPTLRWRADVAHGAVDVAIYVPGEEKAVHAATASNGSYRVPMALKPDTDYVWTIATAGQELGSGRFHTLAADALHKLEAHRPAEKSEFSDRLLFALMLHELGAQQEARETWARLSQERADLPELARLAN